jgi:hypothetical protein
MQSERTPPDIVGLDVLSREKTDGEVVSDLRSSLPAQTANVPLFLRERLCDGFRDRTLWVLIYGRTTFLERYQRDV